MLSELSALRPSSLLESLEAVRRLLSAWRLARFRVHGLAGGAIEARFTGSLIRGAFGSALHRRVCIRKGSPCRGCPHFDRCLYPLHFERPEEGSFPANRGGLPHPFALSPPERLAAGPVTFDLKLFFPPAEQLPHLLAAIVDAGRAGLGRERIPFAVTRIDSLGAFGLKAEAVFEEGGDLAPERTQFISGASFFETPPAGDPLDLRVRLLTPLRMKEGGRLRQGFPFERLVRAALRRLTALGALCRQEWPQRWPDLLEAARGVETASELLRWLDWSRYSLRQGMGMRLGGAVGEVLYRRAPAAILPLLRAAAFAQLGKNVTFGLGCIHVEEAAPS
ncbi:MAG: CRISPR system precrRNA processing endoribonuclease RAMP protein Cas6 [Planctomycetes bacterium]|nr:CRISPR system precrRNA processing endoribonuclease RAMP protein Cas6 [Planctomycetota bacterium]